MTSTLRDRHGRHIEYLRLSVTDRCDLRCSYCMPQDNREYEPLGHWLNFDEIERLVRAFASLGLKRIRLTGGEPLLRRNLSELASKISDIPGIEDLSLSTNATQLSKHATNLKRAGVRRLNVSLDTLDQRKFARLTGRDALGKVLDGLDAASDCGFDPIKINMVAMAGVNDDQIDTMLAYCMEKGFTLRLIETMPIGRTGRNASYMDLQPVRRRLKRQFDLIEAVMTGGGPARYLASRDGRVCIGFITPVSQHFCATCNRVRLSVDGTLFLCLGQEDRFEFRRLLRSGANHEQLRAAINEAILLKPERHEFRESPNKIIRFMSTTGG